MRCRKLAVATLSLLAAPAQAQMLTGQWTGSPDSGTGTALAELGDLDGDGGPEILVSEPGFDDRSGTGPRSSGRVRIYQGRTRAVLREHHGIQYAEHFGQSATIIGDLDGDAIPDYAIGATYYDGLIVDAGRVVAYSGASGVELWSIEGSSTLGEFGAALAPIDDLDGDLRMELLVGVTGVGDVWIVDSNGSLMKVLFDKSGSRFGAAIARAGDLDLDGTRDVLIGAPSYTSGGKTMRGRVAVHSGADASQLYEVLGAATFDEFGSAVAPLGDVDQDGWEDYVVGAAGASPSGVPSGLARILSGKDGALIGEIQGTQNLQRLGQALASVGDWDRDGTDDFAVGAPNASGEPGEVLVVSGATMQVSWRVVGIVGPLVDGLGYRGPAFENIELGAVLASGDFDGNGDRDLLVGDPDYASLYTAPPPPLDDHGLLTRPPPPGPTFRSYSLGSAYLYTGHSAWSENYGTGWPGQNGIPSLTALTDPGIGQQLDVQVTNSQSSSTVALVMVGFTPTDVPTSAGGRLLVVPFTSFALPLPPSGTTLSAVLPGLLLDLYVQVLEVDPFASDGLSFTPGLHLRTGFGL